MIKKYKSKIENVEAISVEDLINLVKTDWYGLPDWFRNEYEKGNIVITSDCLYWKILGTSIEVDKAKVIVKYENGKIFPDTIENFKKHYEEVR